MPHFIFIQQISVLNILHMLYNIHFFSSKCRLFHNATLFGFCITHILNTRCAKIWKKKIRRQKVKHILFNWCVFYRDLDSFFVVFHRATITTNCTTCKMKCHSTWHFPSAGGLTTIFIVGGLGVEAWSNDPRQFQILRHETWLSSLFYDPTHRVV